MGDVYHEHLIKRNLSMSGFWMRILAVLVCFLPTIFAGFLGVFFIAFEALIIYGTYLVFVKTNQEIEYIMVGSECQFDKIFSKKSRKSCGKFVINELELLAPEGSEELKVYEKEDYSVRDFSSLNKNNKRYVAFVRQDTKVIKIIFEPDSEMLKSFQLQAPRKVLI